MAVQALVVKFLAMGDSQPTFTVEDALNKQKAIRFSGGAPVPSLDEEKYFAYMKHNIDLNGNANPWAYLEEED